MRVACGRLNIKVDSYTRIACSPAKKKEGAGNRIGQKLNCGARVFCILTVECFQECLLSSSFHIISMVCGS